MCHGKWLPAKVSSSETVVMTESPAGATWNRPDVLNAAAFDVAFTAMAGSDLHRELAARAYGEDYPLEVEPYGMTTWWTLGRLVSHARLATGNHLIDMACGRGGAGLWLARATGARLTGVDWSPAAIAEAKRRTAGFVPVGRAAFVEGDLAATELPDQSSDVVICLDAVFFAPDRVAALTEVRRLLRPGGRYIFTAAEKEPSAHSRHAVPDWFPLLEEAGLTPEVREVIPRFAEQLQAMYAIWLSELDRIREELGVPSADDMESEATTVGAQVQEDEAVLIVARRP
jgi:ubiquinone/menaquinone biosynthesis C-methylase UbiE